MNNILKFGDKGQNVVLLQQYLISKGFVLDVDGIYGNQTRNAVMVLQGQDKVTVTGIADSNLVTRVTRPTKIDAWALAIKAREGFIAPCKQYPNGTPAWRNNNPGNIEWRGQRNAVENGRFAHYTTYQAGYNDLKTLLIRACTGQSKIYNPEGTLTQFYAGIPPYKKFPGYAPASDGNNPISYASDVAQAIGCSVDIKIKDILKL